jgi:anthranilate/para-aminobenzoate synthase component I
LAPGQLGQHWRVVHEALHWQGDEAELWSWGSEPPDPEAWRARLALAPAPGRASLDLAPTWREVDHSAAVACLQERILEGGFYVANLCVPFQGHLDGDPVTLALSAFQRARSPFGALLDLGGPWLLSLSMERLLARRGDRLWSQPIKGSAPLSGNPDDDQITAKALAADPKERAEHTMILDLVRNDLGRVAQSGSVRVVDPMMVVPFPTVQHLVSTVEVTAKPGLGLAELLRAVLPGGSVTGAPKHTVCRFLAQVEAGPRGFYCGAVGWIAPSGDLDLALPIRTAQIQGEQVTYWAGGGITRRSDPARGWAELHLKTRAMTGWA